MRRALTLLVAFHDGPVGASAASFDIGTRDVLLARRLQALVGNQVPACVDCPRCGELLDISVDLRAVAELPVVEEKSWMSISVEDEPVRFRLPTSEDLLTVVGLDRPQARAVLMRECLGLGPDELPAPDVAAAVDTAMEVVAPAGAVDLLVICPQCGMQGAVPLDVPSLLWSEVETEAAGLLRDVHDLAVRFGWTEPDVLALSPRRRAAYLAMDG